MLRAYASALALLYIDYLVKANTKFSIDLVVASLAS
jgi:hypothetical protein